MIKILWFIHRPERDVEGFEEWYQKEHVPVGMRQERLQRFRISRSFLPQPPFVSRETGTDEPRVYRFSEGYWETLDDVRVCYASPEGRAAIGHGPLNIGPMVPPGPRPVVLLEETVFPVARELDFDLRAGRYRAPLACKLMGVLRLGGKASAFDVTVEEWAKQAGRHPDLRGLVLGRGLEATIRLGRVAQMPPEGAERFDRTVELYFESPEALDRFCDTAGMADLAACARRDAEAFIWDAAQIQEVHFTSRGDQPLEPEWLDFYRRSSAERAE